MRLLDRITGAASHRDAITSAFTFNGQLHPLGSPLTTMRGSNQEDPSGGFARAVNLAYDRSGPVGAAVTARALVLSEMRFKWRDVSTGRLFGNEHLAPLERPSLSMTRQQMLWRIEQDVSYGGNAYIRRMPDDTLVRLRPDWVSILLESDEDPREASHAADARVRAFLYHVGGQKARTRRFVPGEVVQIAPEPDPMATFRGRSWVSTLMKEVLTDLQASDHLDEFFKNAATANMVVKLPAAIETQEQLTEWSDFMEKALGEKWRNFYVASGTDVEVVGSKLADLDMASLTGGLEARIASRSRVPSAVLGTREGGQTNALNQGQYTAHRRLWADTWFYSYAQSVCSSLEPLVPRPVGPTELTFDKAAIAFVQEDRKDEAEILQAKANALQQLYMAGYQPDSIAPAVEASDYSQLVHTGLPSVQAQEVTP